MSVSPTNPFVLPGMGQTGEQASNPLLASMEMMRQAFAGLTGAGGFAAGMPISPPMNPEDLERRISELKTVENWLKLNLSMLSSTIQGMEVQLATIATLRSFAYSMGAANASGSEGPSALEVMLGLQPQSRTGGAAPFASAFSQATPAPQPTPAPQATTAPQAAAQESRQTEPPAATQDAPEPATQAATESDSQNAIPAAAQAWWEMLKTQFGQVAAATAASMSSAGSSATSKAKKTTTPAARSTKPAAKKTSRKQATKKATKQATQPTSTATRSRVAKSAK